MEEQSDTTRTEMAEGQRLNPYFEGRFDGESDELCALRLTLARERDEARAIANDRDAMVDHRDRALTAMHQRVDVITRERDEARALNAQWAEKAAAWFASPEAAQRLQGYRDLAQQVAAAQNERDEARAEVAEIESVLRASGSLNQKLLDEVDRLRALTICGCGDHFNAAFRGLCPNCVAAGKVAP